MRQDIVENLMRNFPANAATLPITNYSTENQKFLNVKYADAGGVEYFVCFDLIALGVSRTELLDMTLEEGLTYLYLFSKD